MSVDNISDSKMKKRSPKNINPVHKKAKVSQSKQSELDAPLLHEAFKEGIKNHLSKLIQSGMDPKKASNVIIHRLLSPYSKLDLHENLEDIRFIQSTSEISSEEAFYAFLIKREIAQHRLLGFNAADAIKELIQRLNNEDEDEEKRHKLGKRKRNNNLDYPDKKKKSDESLEQEYQDNSPDTHEVDSRNRFELFKPRFRNNAARKKFLSRTKLGFINHHEDDLTFDEVEEEEESDVSTEEPSLHESILSRALFGEDRLSFGDSMPLSRGIVLSNSNINSGFLNRQLASMREMDQFYNQRSRLSLRRDDLTNMRLSRMYEEIDEGISSDESDESDEGEAFPFPPQFS